VDVPQTRTLTVADFEGGTLSDGFVSEGDVTVQSSVVDAGDFALQINGTKNGVASTDGLSAYPQSGDTFEYALHQTDTDDATQFYFGTQDESALPADAYRLITDADGNNLELAIAEGFSFSDLDIDTNATFSNHLNEWVSVRIEWGVDGRIRCTATANDGSEIGSVSATDSTYESGGISVRSFNAVASAPTVYFDSVTTERRVGEYYSETQNGSVKLGNDVQPSGAIETGPNELPTDTDQAILADQPVTDGLTQGERVSYGLYVAQQQIARVQAEANGTGGIQNPRLVHDELAVNPTRGADPTAAELGEGNSAVYVSDGSGDVTGDDGDVILAVNSGGTVKTTTLADFSAL
jgi:hypothetical protein